MEAYVNPVGVTSIGIIPKNEFDCTALNPPSAVLSTFNSFDCAPQRHGELEAARARLDGMDGMVGELVGQLVAMSQQMAEATAAADRARAELEAYRSRPWWLRLTG